MFEQDWVLKLSDQLRDCLLSNIDFMGIQKSSSDGSRPVKMLDYACGNGIVSRALKDHFDRIRGVDVSETMVAYYNDMVQEAGIASERMHTVRGNLLDASTPLEDPDLHHLDAVIMSMALHHMADAEAMMGKMVGRLRSGGVVVILDWITDDAERVHHSTGAVGHHTTSKHSFTEDEMCTLFVVAGCALDSVGFHPYKESSHIPESVTNTKEGVDRTFFIAKARKL